MAKNSLTSKTIKSMASSGRGIPPDVDYLLTGNRMTKNVIQSSLKNQVKKAHTRTQSADKAI